MRRKRGTEHIEIHRLTHTQSHNENDVQMQRWNGRGIAQSIMGYMCVGVGGDVESGKVERRVGGRDSHNQIFVSSNKESKND